MVSNSEIGRADLAHEINSVLDYLSEGVRVSESEACQWARSYLEAHLDELSEALGETVTAPLTDEQVISLGLSNADGIAQFKLEEGIDA